MTLTKRCSKCGEVKALELFYGRNAVCISCYNERRRRYRAENKEAVAEQRRRYQTENKEAIAEGKRRYLAENRKTVNQYKRRYYGKNKEAAAERGRLYRAKNKEAIAERRAKNKETIAERQRRWRAEARSSYLKSLASRSTGLPRKDIPVELIELKRLTLKAKRTCRAINNLTQGNEHE